MKIVYYPSPILHRGADEVAQLDEDTRMLIDGMKQQMLALRGIGLAAPQVGVPKRIFITQPVVAGPITVFINPHLLYTSKEQWDYEEGCLSIPEVYATISRSQSLRISARDERWKPFVLEADGLFGRVILHEYDHIEGRLFIDYLPEQEREALLKSYRAK